MTRLASAQKSSQKCQGKLQDTLWTTKLVGIQKARGRVFPGAVEQQDLSCVAGDRGSGHKHLEKQFGLICQS